MKDQKELPKLVVGVGASAGGLEAFKELMSALPAPAGMAFLLVQHLAPAHKSLLSELLAPCTQMNVRDADQGLSIEPDCVYVIRPDTALAVKDGKIELSTPTLQWGVRLPVDHLFRSLAQEYGARAVGIVLSGAGSDGSSGMREIKAAGGLTIAQDPGTSGQRGIPQSAIDTGIVDLVLPIKDMPAALQRFANLPEGAHFEPKDIQADEHTEKLMTLSESELGRLAVVLEAQMNFDLRVYKPSTIERRVLRRMALSGSEDIDSYFNQLLKDEDEQKALVCDLLINVTEFFRDPQAFHALREMVIDPMVAQAPTGSSLRAWVPGCATGEEAYSIGMELLDAVDAANKRLSVQIFATDIDQDTLAVGRAGVYSASACERISQSRLQNYFKPLEGKGFQVRPVLRDVVSFAVHDLTKDPPFSRMNLVSCRNVMIYLASETQKHVLKILHFALEQDGCLFMSTSESTGTQRDLFATVSKSHRIYRKVGVSRPIAVARSRNRTFPERDDVPVQPVGVTNRRQFNSGDSARRAVLEAMVPPTIVVSADGAVIFSHGELAPYLRIPEGDNPRLELSTMLRSDIATRTRAALYKCRRTREVVTALSSLDKAFRRVRISARPAPALGDETVILTFEDVMVKGDRTQKDRPETGGERAVIEQLEKELQATREDLRNTVEELETSNEELRSSHEETMSMNEELQSANEELEATTEELRSLNEELTTVNAQLREKVEQVEQAHDDLNNFFSSTKVATIFLDERLCIKRFTPAARELLGLDLADSGRFISDIARELLQNDLDRQAKAVLEHLSPTSHELRTSDGRWIVRHVLPYRTEIRRIEGVVVTFTDVTELRAANEMLNEKNRRLELAWEAARGGIFEHRIPLDASTYVSAQWANVLGYRLDELPPHDQLLAWLNEQTHQDDRSEFARGYQDLVAGLIDQFTLELRIRHHAGHWIWVRKIARVIENAANGHGRRILRMMLDITDLKLAEASLKESEGRFREMANSLPLMVWVHDENGEQEMVNQTYCEFYGVSVDELHGGRWEEFLHPDDAEGYIREFQAAIQEKRRFHAEARVRRADGSWRWIESWGRPRMSPTSQFRGLVGTSADITERRNIEQVLRKSEQRFRMLADNISQLAWTADRLGVATWYNRRWYEYTGTNWEEMQGEGWTKVQHSDHVGRVIAGVQAARDAEEPWEDTFPLKGANGEYRWFLSRAIPIRDETNKIICWFGTNTDVDDLRQVEQKLLQADRQKDEFLAMLGHELRNPLAAIRTASALMKRGALGALDEARFIKAQQVLDRQTMHMAKLLDGLLDVSRIIRGKIKLDFEILDLGAICADALTDTAASFEARKLKLQSDIPPRPVWVRGDRVRLGQIIGNLLSNAIKFTPEGGSIRLAVEQRDTTAVLSVIDTGVGLEPELIPHIFEIFRQSEQTIDRSNGGLGLGLALVKTLTELHGGHVEARSEGLGKGAQLIVTLPVSQTAQSGLAHDVRAHDGILNVVLIEDNEDTVEVLRQVLEEFGHRVSTALQGEKGLELVRQVSPDVVFCDLGLPGKMNGFDVARELRADEKTRHIPLVALSGYGRPEDKQRSFESGFDVHMTKPAEIADFERVLRELTDKNKASR